MAYFYKIIGLIIFSLTLSGLTRYIYSFIQQQKRYKAVLYLQNKIYRMRKNIITNKHNQSECPICFTKGDYYQVSCGHIICPICFKKHYKCPICLVSRKYLNNTIPNNQYSTWGYLIYKLIYISKLYPEFNWDINNFLNYNYRYPYDLVEYDNFAGHKDNNSVDIGELFS